MVFLLCSKALVCVDAVVSQKCADELLLAALEFLSSLGKIFIPPENQVLTPPNHNTACDSSQSQCLNGIVTSDLTLANHGTGFDAGIST